MKALNLYNSNDDELLSEFATTAKQMGSAVLDSDTQQANRMYHHMRAIDTVLRSRGKMARLKLVPLLNDQDRFVRYYTAGKLLGVVPEPARAVIEWNAKNRFDAIAGDARGLLRAFDSGEYKPD